MFPSNIILGLDAATEKDVVLLRKIIADIGLENVLTQWNDGPNFAHLYDVLQQSGGIDLSQRGKGRNVFMSFGVVAIALSATSVGLLDADVRTFKRSQLDRLFYPVQVFNYQFAKAYTMPEAMESNSLVG